MARLPPVIHERKIYANANQIKFDVIRGKHE